MPGARRAMGIRVHDLNELRDAICSRKKEENNKARQMEGTRYGGREYTFQCVQIHRTRTYKVLALALTQTSAMFRNVTVASSSKAATG